MLDYAALDPQLLAAIVGDLAAALGTLAAATVVGPRLCTEEEEEAAAGAGPAAASPLSFMVVGVLDGCCYVVRPDLLVGPQAPRPALITFRQASGGGAVQPGWADEAEAAAVWAQLDLLVAAFQQGDCAAGSAAGSAAGEAGAESQAAAGGGWEAAGGGRRRGGAGRGAVAPPATTRTSLPTGPQPFSSPAPLVTLDGLAGLPPMPTLSGLLLGYPAVYVVRDLAGAEAASRCLSATSLTFYTATLQPGDGSLGSSLPGSGGGSAGGEHPLLAFSVPAQLAGDPDWEAARAAWLAALRERVGAAGFPWTGAALGARHSAPRPIAL